MKKILLSIIIPYYNTYNYTIKLLKELNIQYTDDIEVILVDDGCNEVRFDVFERFTIIHLDKNYGASYAWNRGIDAAKGSYIAFIDSDDMISMDYVDTLVDAIKNHTEDVIKFA
jgi:heptose III glucuronosyltransferase